MNEPPEGIGRSTDLTGLYLITDGGGNKKGRIERVAAAALDGGLRMLQLREKAMPTGDLCRLAERLRIMTERAGARFIVNDRLDVALATGADGVHLGVDSLPVEAVRDYAPSPFLIGASTHSMEELRDAEAKGADFVTFGPVYATPSKLEYGSPVGVATLREAIRTAGVPVFGLGGITRDRVREVLDAGATGVALISAVWSAPDITGETRAFLALVSRGERS